MDGAVHVVSRGRHGADIVGHGVRGGGARRGVDGGRDGDGRLDL